ncbi:hypothetical protein ACFB49_45250 [Sphingomonas sp. DBB INV C78]|uniref:flagellar basal body P-ring formation chaperone FlgA n=1 Tax=Sphingomonas sp. DBB INV C78 TaxID=3349434 RepID=UPI0036D2DD41
MASLFIAALLAGAAPAAAATVDAPVLARTVEKGEILSAGDFVVAPVMASIARSAIQPQAAAGKEAVRRLAAGAPVRTNDVVRPRLVRRGEAVTIALVSGPLTITSAGRAMTDGGAGDNVRVLNTSTNRTLDGIVEPSGRVRVAGQ